MQFSSRSPDDASTFRSLMRRNANWALMNGYRYRLESVPNLRRRSVYFEKVRMALQALRGGAPWALWVDDDAVINIARISVEDWLDRYPTRDLIIAKQAGHPNHAPWPCSSLTTSA